LASLESFAHPGEGRRAKWIWTNAVRARADPLPMQWGGKYRGVRLVERQSTPGACAVGGGVTARFIGGTNGVAHGGSFTRKFVRPWDLGGRGARRRAADGGSFTLAWYLIKRDFGIPPRIWNTETSVSAALGGLGRSSLKRAFGRGTEAESCGNMTDWGHGIGR